MNYLSEWLQQAPIRPPGGPGIPIYKPPPSTTTGAQGPGASSTASSTGNTIALVIGGVAVAGVTVWLLTQVPQ